jgi:hypothetical protein
MPDCGSAAGWCGSCGGLKELWQADQIVTRHFSVNLKPSFLTPRSMGRESPPIVLPVHGEFVNPRKNGAVPGQPCELPTSCYRRYR